jgi:hypothetical protein
MIEPINPSVWRSARPNTVRKINPVWIVMFENKGWPPRVVRARNQKDVEEIPEDVRKQLEIVWLEWVDDAVSSALEPKTAATIIV